MSSISEFAARQREYANKMDVAVAGLHGDFDNLNNLIKELQSSNDPVTVSDQKLLDDIEAHSKLVADKLSALDDLTPPKAPVA